MAKIWIDGKEIIANEGDYVLRVARANGIFIPAICYLSGCSPTLACKMCMVEIDGKRVYACNAKIKEGMSVLTITPEILTERKAIMQSYAVNHPLECGVCDKSGECELQDFVHLYEVDNQEFFVEDSMKNFGFWGSVKYDPSLCIMCERCVTTCKDNLGEANLKAQKADLPQIDSAWKERMPKDAFGVWSRKQKALIGFVGENPCFDCAECASVCPVGALGVKSFQYSTNAWELDKTSSTCALCPAGCKIVYESKLNFRGERKIYRVSNDFDFNPICGAGRFAYDMGGICDSLEEGSLQEAKTAIQKAAFIAVGGNVSNDEVRFLNLVREKFNKKLINPSLERYRDFREILLQNGVELAKMRDLGESSVIFTLGINLVSDNPLLRYKINNALKMNKNSTLIYAYPLGSKLISGLSKKLVDVRYSPNCDDVAALLLLGAVDFEAFCAAGFMQDSSENIADCEIFKPFGVEKINEILALLNAESKPIVVLGSDIYNHPNALNIAKILAYLAKNDKIRILLNPPSANANGILENLHLDSSAEFVEFVESSSEINAESSEDSSMTNPQNPYIVGFRECGDFRFDVAEADFRVPFYHSMNDVIMNIDYKILPLNAVFEKNTKNYLNCLANFLGLDFRAEMQNLSNDYGNDGADNRGVEFTPKMQDFTQDSTQSHDVLDSTTLQAIKNSFGKFGFEANAILVDIAPHFAPYTHLSDNFERKVGVYATQDTLANFGFNSGDLVQIGANGTESRIDVRIFVDSDIQGDFMLVSPQIKGVRELFKNGRFASLRIVK